MIKTLTVTIKDTTEESELSVRGTRDEAQFNPVVVLVTPMGQIAVNSQDLAKALAEVVNFQTVAAPKEVSETYPHGVTITKSSLLG